MTTQGVYENRCHFSDGFLIFILMDSILKLSLNSPCRLFRSKLCVKYTFCHCIRAEICLRKITCTLLPKLLCRISLYPAVGDGILLGWPDELWEHRLCPGVSRCHEGWQRGLVTPAHIRHQSPQPPWILRENRYRTFCK